MKPSTILKTVVVTSYSAFLPRMQDATKRIEFRSTKRTVITHPERDHKLRVPAAPVGGDTLHSFKAAASAIRSGRGCLSP